jgi:hypothetical protein
MEVYDERIGVFSRRELRLQVNQEFNKSFAVR